MVFTDIPDVPLYTGDAPNRNTQEQSEFSANSDDSLQYQSTLADNLNATTAAINTVADEVQVVADEAQDSADKSAASASIAESTANFVGRWSDQSGSANIPYSVFHDSRNWQLLSNLADVTLSEPSSINSDWDEISGALLEFNTVSDFQSGLTSSGVVVTTPNGSSCKTLGYYAIGDGGGYDYVVSVRTGGYGQNKVIEFPLNADESIALPIISEYKGSVAGILPSAANTNLSKNFNELAGKADSIGQRRVHIEFDSEFLCEDELNSVNSVQFVGDGKIISPLANNYYKRIYPDLSTGTQLTTCNSSGSNAKHFANAIERRNGGGANPVVVFIGDSLTQGAHRESDNYWWVRDCQRKLSDEFGSIDFYNRGIAGTKIEQVFNVVQDATPINAPFEPAWNTVPGQQLDVYVGNLNPDLVIIAFGMNSNDNGFDTADITTARNDLAIAAPSSDFMWVTTPIRTTDLNVEFPVATKFGTWPENEKSNQAGLATRFLAKSFGDYCIDVNRMSSIVHLGQDPVNLRMNRWAGQFQWNNQKFINDNLITVEVDQKLTVDIGPGQFITSKEMFRDIAVEFDVTTFNGALGEFRVILRDDPTSDSQLMFRMLETAIVLSAFKVSSGTQATWNIAPLGKKIRISAIGSTVNLYIDDVLTAPDSGSTAGLEASMFLAPMQVISTTGATIQLTDFNVNGGARWDYQQHVPLLGPNQVFNVEFGGGGNNLNHPNSLGEREMYSQPVSEFVSWLANVKPIFEPVQTVVAVAGSTGTLTAVSSSKNTVTLHFEDLNVVGSDGVTAIVQLSSNPDLRPLLTVSGTLSNVATEDDTKRVQVRSTGDIFIQGGIPAGNWAGSVTYAIA